MLYQCSQLEVDEMFLNPLSAHLSGFVSLHVTSTGGTEIVSRLTESVGNGEFSVVVYEIPLYYLLRISEKLKYRYFSTLNFWGIGASNVNKDKIVVHFEVKINIANNLKSAGD